MPVFKRVKARDQGAQRGRAGQGGGTGPSCGRVFVFDTRDSVTGRLQARYYFLRLAKKKSTKGTE